MTTRLSRDRAFPVAVCCFELCGFNALSWSASTASKGTVARHSADKDESIQKKTALADLHNHIDAQEHPFFKSTSDAVTDCDRLSWDTVTGHLIGL